MLTVTKIYQDLPAAHRQPDHDGHCRLIHGHNWKFEITFACRAADHNGFIVDVGKLDLVRDFLKENFDHTLLLNFDDPYLNWCRHKLESLHKPESNLAKICIVPNCSMEGLAQFVYSAVNEIILENEKFEREQARGLICSKVVVWEDAKNFVTYEPD